MLISLVGLPGVGKSTLGKRLAHRLGFRFLDCDVLIERRLGEKIAGYFDREGEAAFRDLEESTLQEAAASERAVIATGGGVVVRPDNRRLLRDRTVCVYLRAEPTDLLVRLQRSGKRPLLKGDDVEGRLLRIAQEREPLYREAARLVIDTRRQSGGKLLEILECALLPYLGPGATVASGAEG